MNNKEFRAWLTSVECTHRAAASELGITEDEVASYAADGDIPKVVELACTARLLGYRRYAGPQGYA